MLLPCQFEYLPKQRPPEEDVDPGVEDGVYSCYPDGCQVSVRVIVQNEAVGKHTDLKEKNRLWLISSNVLFKHAVMAANIGMFPFSTFHVSQYKSRLSFHSLS